MPLPKESIEQRLAYLDGLLEETFQTAILSSVLDEHNAVEITVRSHLRAIAALIGVLGYERLPRDSSVATLPFDDRRRVLEPYLKQFLASARRLQRCMLPDDEPDDAADCEPEFAFESLLVKLTKRQKDALTYVLNGEANKIIAYKLNITEATAKAHVSSLLRKFAVPSRARLIAMFRRS